MSTPPTPFFSWEGSYCLNSRVIDEQHKHLVGLVAELHESVTAHEPKDAHAKILTALYNSALAHFATEEQLLRFHQHPRYPVHKAAHEGLAHALNGLRQQVALGERALSPAYVDLIKLWLIDHFGEFDRPCENILRDKNPDAEVASGKQPSTMP